MAKILGLNLAIAIIKCKWTKTLLWRLMLIEKKKKRKETLIGFKTQICLKGWKQNYVNTKQTKAEVLISTDKIEFMSRNINRYNGMFHNDNG